MSRAMTLLLLGVAMFIFWAGFFIMIYRNKWLHIMLIFGGSIFYMQMIAAESWNWFEAFVLGVAVSTMIYIALVSSYYLFRTVKRRLDKATAPGFTRTGRKDGGHR